ncbi:hypothetical protein [Rhodoferax sp.]|uniref:hypothetical protein n=1 Tax=Rhodoferax sp. TaxID=50421 RepID=UPI00274FD69D|nr:hypothetical protein [Rhodoferax sp.]
MEYPLFPPPQLLPLEPILKRIPVSLLPWIAEKHVQYLDDRIHKIDRLTDYLANCDQVASERTEFIEFVDSWARKNSPDLLQYLSEYATRFAGVRDQVERLCDRVLDDPTLWSTSHSLLAFWEAFTKINEIDSLHGMFLTSGRWYINAMLPAVKELVYCSLPAEVSEDQRQTISYDIARRVITPRFAIVTEKYDHSLERRFGMAFMRTLQYYDRKLLFLFEVMSGVKYESDLTLKEFVVDVGEHPDPWAHLLEMGVYPPFGWHELHASRRARRPASEKQAALSMLMQLIPPEYAERAKRAFHVLEVLKSYELNYNNYNYKGKFGLVSKYQYWRTAELLPEAQRQEFFDTILLDGFYDAFAIVRKAFA